MVNSRAIFMVACLMILASGAPSSGAPGVPRGLSCLTCKSGSYKSYFLIISNIKSSVIIFYRNVSSVGDGSIPND